MASTPVRISFYGHFGSMNTGNESTLLAILSRLRHLYPDCEFCCICSYPDVVAARDGIEAVPISKRVAKIWNRETPLEKRLKTAAIGICAELREYVRAFTTLGSTDMLIIPGTGLLTDAYGLSAWGPYNIFKWSLIAKLRGCRLLFVSVGAGPIDGFVGRILVKSALSLADYRSYRDDSSRHYLSDIGFRPKQDRVYPDLAFSLPQADLPSNHTRVRHRRVVGIGLMVYPGRYSALNPRPDTYNTYLESVAALVKWLLANDYDIRLLLGDEDTEAIEELNSLLRNYAEIYDEERVIYEPITSVQKILSQLATTDMVIATRFHNILLALRLNKPVVAISFHPKCVSLMSEMQLSQYCIDIHDIDRDSLITTFRTMERDRDSVALAIRERTSEAREALDEQYEFLFEKL